MTSAPLRNTRADADAVTAKLTRTAPADVIDAWLLAEPAAGMTASAPQQQRWGQVLAAAGGLLGCGLLWWLVTA